MGLVGKASSIFQSTPPARGATAPCRQETLLSSFQSTPPARGATYIKATVEIPFPISIHAPREGGDAAHRKTSV